MSCLDRRAPPLSAPVDVFLNVTSKCNLACVYCSSASFYDGEVDELTGDDMRRLAARFDDLGLFRLKLTGGEPLLRRDLFDLVELFKPRRRGVGINSNGTLIDGDAARRMRALGVRQCAVSLDGADEATNAATRGRGALARTLSGVEALAAAGVPIAILCTVSRLNYRGLREVARLGREYGAENVSFNTVNCQGKAAPRYSELMLDAAQRLQVAQELLDLRANFYPRVSGDFLVFSFALTSPPPRWDGTLLPCGAAKETCVIGADGWVFPCDKMPMLKCGNVKMEDIKAIWNAEPMRRVRALAGQPVRLVADCADCAHVSYCAGGCRGDAFLATGSLYGRDPLCYAHSPAVTERARA